MEYKWKKRKSYRVCVPYSDGVKEEVVKYEEVKHEEKEEEEEEKHK